MTEALQPFTTRQIRRDGWTYDRRQKFVDMLGAGFDVRRACAGVGMSRQTAYALRRRDPEFARGWDEAQRSARAAADAAFLAILPERFLRAMSELSGECQLRDGGDTALSRFDQLKNIPFPVRVERSRDTGQTCLDFARHERRLGDLS